MMKNQTNLRDEWAIQVAQDIYDTLHCDLEIFLSWGVNPESYRIVRHCGMPGLQFEVNGFIHQGDVMVLLNSYDTFDVLLIKDNVIVSEQSGIYVDQLISYIDDNVEKCDNYDERVYETYKHLIIA